MSDSNSSPKKADFKSLLVKGLVSAAALAGTTAIPIVVQRLLQPPTATVPGAPVQVAPSSSLQQMGSAETLNQVIGEDGDDGDDKPKGKGKKRQQE